MYINSIQNNNFNTKQSFNGSIDKSVYKMVRKAKYNVVFECCSNEIAVPYSKYLIKALNETLDELGEFVKNLHPDTKLKLRSAVEQNTGKKFILLQAQNNKINKTLNLRRLDKSACSSPFDEMSMIRAELAEVVKKVSPKDIDYTLFSATEKDFAKTSNKRSYGLIDRLFLRYKAKKLDKLAPEFHANPNVLHRLDARIKIIDRVNRH